jgi:hypothetical protein
LKKPAAVITLPEIQATSQAFSAVASPEQKSVGAGMPIDVVMTFSSTQADALPPMLVLYWYKNDGATKRVPVQQHSTLVDRQGMTGNAKVATKVPQAPGEYKIQLVCALESSTRSIEFPIVVSPQ